jgi:site-specific DNA-methyltransferase (cytosine-N4-specific)
MAEIIDGYKINLDEIKTKDKNYLTHGIHPYPAKYIPQIPASLIKYLNLLPGSTVLDPFCGSGTTLLEANINGLNAYGIDTNPIACLVSKVKTSIISEEQAEMLRSIRDSILSYKRDMIEDSMLPNFKNRDHWFQTNVLYELTYIKNVISQEKDELLNNILKVTLSAIIVKVSNQESDTRWVAKDKKIDDRYAINEYCKKLEQIIGSLRLLSSYKLGNTKVYCSDSQNQAFIQDESIDCAITSPPYMNSYDYYLYHKLRMFWLDYNHYDVQNAEIGSRNKHCDNGASSEDYYTSIGNVCEQVYSKLRRHGYFCIVIGDSIKDKKVILMNEVYEKILTSKGFQLQECFSFNQRKYTKAFTPNIKTQEKQTHIMIFKK